MCTHTLTERQMIALTRVNLSVTAHSIGIYNILEARGKFVGPNQGWGSAVGGNTVDEGRNRRSAFSLKYQHQIKLSACCQKLILPSCPETLDKQGKKYAMSRHGYNVSLWFSRS